MRTFLSRLSLVGGLIGLLFTAAFLFRMPQALALIPWQLTPLSSLFLSSIFAAIAAPVIWVGLTREAAATLGGTINLGIMYSGMAVFSWQLYSADTARGNILVFGLVCATMAVVCLALTVAAAKLPYLDTRPMPALVRYSFVLFAVVLLLTGTALTRQMPNIFPWPLKPELSVFYGWIFLGAMCYFIYGALKPLWANAQGQLLGFLAYDLVLIGPYIKHFAKVSDEMRLSLTIYVSVLVYSGLLACYFLFIHPPTRFRWGEKRSD